MPFIDAKLTVAVSPAQSEAVKCGLAAAVAAFGKGESFLMVGIDDEYELWLGGARLDHGAYVSVSLVGDTPGAACATFTADVCELLERELAIPAENVYVTFHPMPGSRWGWNGGTF